MGPSRTGSRSPLEPGTPHASATSGSIVANVRDVIAREGIAATGGP